MVDEDAQITGWDRRRLHLTPGMTGHWQIAGSARVPLHEMVKMSPLQGSFLEVLPTTDQVAIIGAAVSAARAPRT